MNTQFSADVKIDEIELNYWIVIIHVLPQPIQSILTFTDGSSDLKLLPIVPLVEVFVEGHPAG